MVNSATPAIGMNTSRGKPKDATAELWGTGKSPKPLGTANRMSAPYQAVKAKDGHFVFGAANQKLWLSFLEVVGRQELAEDPRFKTPQARWDNRAEFDAILGEQKAEADPSVSIASVHSFSCCRLPQLAGLPVRSTWTKSRTTGRSLSDA